MSMYNMLFGVDNLAPLLLSVLGLKREDTGRFRDCYLDGDKIVVYTRNGGGNREEFQGVFDKLAQHKNYVRDYDDDFDSTYASIEFSFPDEYKEDLLAMSKLSQSAKPSDKWSALLEKLKTGEVR